MNLLYHNNTNQLRYVEDRQNNDGLYDNDLDNQVTKTGAVVGADTVNYTGACPEHSRRDAIGNLVSDIAEEIDEIQWYINGKVKAIKRTGSSTKADLYFAYGPDGQRIRKVAVTGSGSDTTWYVRDAQGNTMAIYSPRGMALGPAKRIPPGLSCGMVYDPAKRIPPG